MLGRLAAAYAGVSEVFFLKGDTTALYAAGYVLKLVLALAVAAPHSLDKAGLVLGGVDKLLIACGCEGLFLSVLKGAVVHILMNSNEQLFNVFTKSVEGYKRLFASIAADNYALVTGIRAQRKDSQFKRLQSKIANGFRRSMTHDGAQDTGCPLKVMQTKYAKRIPFFTGMHRFLPALILLQDGGTYQQIPVHHFPRTAGKSKYHLYNRLVAPFVDCFAYRWMKKRYINYQIGEDNLRA